jgi:hypothetical protein
MCALVCVDAFTKNADKEPINLKANDIPGWTTIYWDSLNEYNNTKHSATGFAPNDRKSRQPL